MRGDIAIISEYYDNSDISFYKIDIVYCTFGIFK